ncbi:MAG: hypothetical protein ACRED9_11210 [Caulobacteraceae bacterium]
MAPSMTPRLTEILLGCIAAISAPPPPETGPEFAASRHQMTALLLAMAAGEAERAAAAAAWENAAIRDLFAASARLYDGEFEGALGTLAAGVDADFSLSALEASNAALRRRLTTLHAAAERQGDEPLDRRIISLYGEMAAAHRLDFPRG